MVVTVSVKREREEARDIHVDPCGDEPEDFIDAMLTAGDELQPGFSYLLRYRIIREFFLK